MSRVVAARRFGAGSVIGEKQDQGVISLSNFIENIHKSPDVLIHVVDHGGIHLHAQLLPLQVAGFALFPRLRQAVPLLDSPVLIDQSEFFLAGKSLLSQHVPPLGVFAFVLRDILWLRMQRVVRSGVRQIVKERLSGRRETLDRFDGMIGKGVGGEVIVWKIIKLEKLFVVTERTHPPTFELRIGDLGIEEITAAVPEAIGLIETAIERNRTLGFSIVPLPGHPGLVARVTHRLSQRQHLLSDQLGLSPTSVARIQSGQQRRSCGGALGVVVELRKEHSLAGDPVDVRRFDLRAVAANV